MGMSAPEWSRYLRDVVGLPGTPERISEQVVAGLLERYARRLPWIAGAREAVERIAAYWPLALATSSNREIVERGAGSRCVAPLLRGCGLLRGGRPRQARPGRLPRGRRPTRDPAAHCAAVEDSSNGLRAAAAASMRVIAIPNAAHPPEPDALALADVVLDSLDELTPAAIEPGG